MNLATHISSSADTSRADFMTCPCWNPWKTGCKRLKRTKTGTQMPKSWPVSAGMKDQSQPQISIKLPLPSRTDSVPLAQKIRLQRRGAQDISRDFIEPSAGSLSHKKQQLSFSLEKNPFVKKKSEDTSFSKPILDREDVVADLVEQISELTSIMEQMRRDHEKAYKELENEMKEKCDELKEEHASQVRQIRELHKSEVDALEEQYRKEVRMERASAQEKLSGMQKEYKYLKNAFRVYQDSISDEMEEKWLRRQAEWKKSERTEREKALLQQKQSLTRKFEIEIEEHKKKNQNTSFLVDKAYQQERKDFIKQQEENAEKIRVLTGKVNALEEQLKEKNETLNAIASTLHHTEMELQNEKAIAAETEKTVLQRIAAAEEKCRANMNSLVEENVALRRKLIEKNEEIFHERTQRSGVF